MLAPLIVDVSRTRVALEANPTSTTRDARLGSGLLLYPRISQCPRSFKESGDSTANPDA